MSEQKHEVGMAMTKSVLIIDDDSQSRSVLRIILKSLNCEIYEASNGWEGIESYRRNPTDIVITDILMPEKDGLETIKDLKKEFPEIKIIAISGIDLGTMDYLQAARDFGAMHCIRKPVSFDDIIGIVSQTL